MRAFLRAQRALGAALLVLALANMTDRTWAAKLMDFTYHGSAAPTTPTQPLHLRLMTAQGSNTANGTEATAGSEPGYTAGGATMGNPAFGASSAGVSANSNAVSWTAAGGWAAIVAIEVWDTAGTPVRYAQGSITSVTLANGNTLTFPATTGVTADASAW